MTTTTNTPRTPRSETNAALKTLCTLAALASTACAANAQCDPAWGPVGSGASSQVYTFEVFDDGSGDALYMGGVFQSAGGLVVNQIAKWDGKAWSALAAGLSSSVTALEVFDDGTGPALYVGGSFTSASGEQALRIAKWDGTSWTSLGDGMDGMVSELVTFDDGHGPMLYACGSFGRAGSQVADLIARWDGTAWSSVGGGLPNSPSASSMAVYDDGTGPALFVGGNFDMAGSTVVGNIAKWDGTNWSSIGPGFTGIVGHPKTMTVADTGTGPKLVVAGTFSLAGSAQANNIAAWDGSQWTPVGAGFNGSVNEIKTVNTGSGPSLYAAGTFTESNGLPMLRVAKWDGSSWHAVGGGVNANASGIGEFDAGSGPQLYLGGGFWQAGSAPVSMVAQLSVPLPSVTTQPADTNAMVGNSASFTVAAASPPGPYSVRWRKDGQPLFDSPPRITGTGTTKLTINPVDIPDAGLYDALLTNACGSTTTRAATLTVTYKFCYVDCDQSTGPRVLDIFDFLCFQSAFVKFEPYADCDGNNVLEIFDFLCFQDAFVSGCP